MSRLDVRTHKFARGLECRRDMDAAHGSREAVGGGHWRESLITGYCFGLMGAATRDVASRALVDLQNS
jgi:hypothetical protein